jgi:hypothetical protein
LDWLELERSNLITVRAAADYDLHELGWHLAAALWPLFLLHDHYLAVRQVGVRCAQQWGNHSAHALMHNRRGAACRGHRAIRRGGRALQGRPGHGCPRRQPGDRDQGGRRAAAGRAGARQAQAALGHVADLRLSTELYRQHDVGLALINLGAALTKTGRAAEGISAALTGEARRLYDVALPVLVDLGRPNPPKSTPACRPSVPGPKSLDLLTCASLAGGLAVVGPVPSSPT